MTQPYRKQRPYFSGPVRAEWAEDNDRDMIMLDDLTFYSLKFGMPFTINKGERFNGKSVPRLLWATHLGGSPFTGPARKAAPIHDTLCRRARAYQTRKLRKHYRHQADDVFYEMMKHLGVGPIKRGVMYRAVRLGALFSVLIGLIVFSSCSSMEKNVRYGMERKIEKIATPIAEEAARDAIAQEKSDILRQTLPVGTGGGGAGAAGLLWWMHARKKKNGHFLNSENSD